MNQKRSWPGVPNRYSTRREPLEIRPKSMATVVVVLPATPVRSSTPIPTCVRDSSVRSGRISLIALTSVVLPTPNPPATTILTGVSRLPSASPSEGAEPIEYLLEQLGAGLLACGRPRQHGDHALLNQVGQQDADHTQRQGYVGGHVGHGNGGPAQDEELAVLGVQLGELRGAPDRTRRGDDRDQVEHHVAHRVGTASGQRIRPDDRPGLLIGPPVVPRHGGLTRRESDVRGGWAARPGAARPALR